MAEAKFDPYHAWLGIPAWDRPVNAYRLLGVEVFEQNRKVIEAAANRQMAYLQELSSGDEHIEEAQKMLGLVSRARVLLLNPGKKTAYDKKLTAQLDSLPEVDEANQSSVALPTRSSAAVPQAKKEKSMNRATVVRTTLLAFAGALAIIVVLLFKPTPLIVQVYEDKNKNKMLEAGEELTDVGVIKVRIDPSKRGGGELDINAYITEEFGEAKIRNVPEGPVGFAVQPPFELTAKGKLFIEVDVESGPRFFAQRVLIPVQRQPTTAKIAVKKSSSQRPTNTRITLRGDIFAHNAEGERGHIFDRNAEGEEEPWETYVYLDLDGNGIYNKVTEPYWTKVNAEGKYEFTFPRKAIQSQTALRLIESHQYYQDPGAIPLSLAEAKDGVLEIVTELKRKPTSIEGTLSVMPEGESAEGFVVYMDLNENDQADEEEPQAKTDSDGNYGLEFTQFDQPSPSLPKIQVSEETYLLPRRLPGATMRNGKSIFSIRGANFQLSKKATPATETTAKKTEPAGESSTGESSTGDGSVESGAQEASEGETPISQIPDPVEEPKAYLMHIGYLPLPEDDNTWQIHDPDAATGFIKAKNAFTIARKKGNWDQRLLELQAVIDQRQAEADKYAVDAGPKSKKRSQDKAEAKFKLAAIRKKIGKWQEEQGGIQAEKERFLSDIRSNLLILTTNSQKFEQAENDKNRNVAATEAKINLSEVPKKHQNIWGTALRFNAESALEEKFRLIAVGKGSRKMWSLRTLNGIKSEEEQFKRYHTFLANNRYFKLKQEQQRLNEDLNFDSPEAQQVKSSLLGLERRFKPGIIKFKASAKLLTELLTQTKVQIITLRENEDQLKILFEQAGSNYKKFFDSLPNDELLDSKIEQVRSVQANLPEYP